MTWVDADDLHVIVAEADDDPEYVALIFGGFVATGGSELCGVPPGGDTGQALVKAGPDDCDLDWGSPGTSLVVEEGDSIIVAVAAALDFLAADFDVTVGPADEANIAISTAIARVAAVAAAISSAIATHEGAGDPHPGYLTAAEGNAAYDAIGAAAAAQAASQPLDGDLTAIAALTTTAFGRSLLELANAAALLAAAGAAAAVHTHSGDDITSGTVAEARIHADITRDSELTAAIAALAAVYQPLDGDLTAIAALTTTAFGRSLLEAANAAALRTLAGLVIGTDVQAWDADLDALATAFARATASGPASLAFHEDTDNGSNKVTVIAPSAVASDRTWTLQDADDTFVGRATTDTLTNKRITKRSNAVAAPGATPSIDTDTYDYVDYTGLATNITSISTSGTPTRGATLWISFTDNGTSRSIGWDATDFEASASVGLPTATTISTRMDVGFVWNVVTSKWRCVAVA